MVRIGSVTGGAVPRGLRRLQAGERLLGPAGVGGRHIRQPCLRVRPPHQVVGHRGHDVAPRLGPSAHAHHLLRIAQPVVEGQLLAARTPVRRGVGAPQYPVARDVQALRAVHRLRGRRRLRGVVEQTHRPEVPQRVAHRQRRPVGTVPSVRRQRTHVDEVRVLTLRGVHLEEIERPDLRRPWAVYVDVDRFPGRVTG